MTERLIQHFTRLDVPLLSIHDSYIVPHDYAQMLRDEMEKAFIQVTKISKGIDDFIGQAAKEAIGIKQISYDDEYLMEVNDELSPEERESDPNMIKHRRVLERSGSGNLNS